jgi:hypothetical protein
MDEFFIYGWKVENNVHEFQIGVDENWIMMNEIRPVWMKNDHSSYW